MSLHHDNPWQNTAAASPPRRLGGGRPTLSERMKDKFDRTKEVVSEGFEKTKEKTKVTAKKVKKKTKAAAKKVKEGTSKGINWIKLKYRKHKFLLK
ncbi:hypothetical protein CDL12_05075 [Handroanthus impetiginosus]|uniref:Uncharacterized protein n=1 Tax=Handroanthus impetiginosus TaxID=429701 RepID=A0A2G9HXI1_9LAMI|nr:hypothetical protein CDL12_05075 [Handroanthus impetiginosus]